MKRDPTVVFGLAMVIGLAVICAAVIYALRPAAWIIPALGH